VWTVLLPFGKDKRTADSGQLVRILIDWSMHSPLYIFIYVIAPSWSASSYNPIIMVMYQLIIL
jgi:hypothetical protein